MAKSKSNLPILDERKLEEGAECLKALASPVRLKILFKLKEQPMCVTDLEKELGISQSSLSQHLRTLRYKGIVDKKREGNKVYYTIASDAFVQLLETLPQIICFKG
ncbi:ArsR/SmtB family transcription factor [Desulfurobacterium atlanticum]|uniref:Transcriptional regulator, ArsR family n=1 Tax=Desulfurobacterium atlanticum TaxID=240169 RepID=A0A239AAY4_9BACT|nr:metalloregulator ArsR/SmtB family transcription factor [Desulfurobacterium atlanticum]SNR92218.1 transcriptional regulator, ArsR family [Desulfurobacterium atlanticum]